MNARTNEWLLTEELRIALDDRSRQIAQLVWNHTDDPKMLDRLLLEELRDQDVSARRGLRTYLVRGVLIQLSALLQAQAPERDLIDFEWLEVA